MDLVVGASESTVKSLLGKLGSLLAQEYTLIRGVAGNLQYINDELTTMQSFLRDLGEMLGLEGSGRPPSPLPCSTSSGISLTTVGW